MLNFTIGFVVGGAVTAVLWIPSAREWATKVWSKGLSKLKSLKRNEDVS